MENYIYERILFKENSIFKFCSIAWFADSLMWFIVCIIFSFAIGSIFEMFNFLTLICVFNCMGGFLLGRYYLNLPKTPYITITDSELLLHQSFLKADRVINIRNIEEIKVGDKKIYFLLNNDHKEVEIRKDCLYVRDTVKLLNILSQWAKITK